MYDQGQQSTKIFLDLNPDGSKRVPLYVNPAVNPSIPRETSYDPTSILQVEQHSSEHVPQSKLIVSAPIPLYKDHNREEDPFYFYHVPSNSLTVEQRQSLIKRHKRNLQLDDIGSIMDRFSINNSPDTQVRYSTKFDQVPLQQFQWPNYGIANVSEQQLFYAAATLINYNPELLSRFSDNLRQNYKKQDLLPVLKSMNSNLLGAEAQDYGERGVDLFELVSDSYKRVIRVDHKQNRAQQLGFIIQQLTNALRNNFVSRSGAYVAYLLLPPPGNQVAHHEYMNVLAALKQRFSEPRVHRGAEEGNMGIDQQALHQLALKQLLDQAEEKRQLAELAEQDGGGVQQDEGDAQQDEGGAQQDDVRVDFGDFENLQLVHGDNRAQKTPEGSPAGGGGFQAGGGGFQAGEGGFQAGGDGFQAGGDVGGGEEEDEKKDEPPTARLYLDGEMLYIVYSEGGTYVTSIHSEGGMFMFIAFLINNILILPNLTRKILNSFTQSDVKGQEVNNVYLHDERIVEDGILRENINTLREFMVPNPVDEPIFDNWLASFYADIGYTIHRSSVRPQATGPYSNLDVHGQSFPV